MSQTKVMRLVPKEKQPKHRGLLKTDEALRSYQDAYDQMTVRYQVVDDRPSLRRRFMRWLKGVK